MLKLLADTRIFFYALLWLMFLLVIGTIVQKDIGLFAAEQKYFTSYIFWAWGIIPLPATSSILIIIFINMLAKLLRDNWQWKNIGTITTHISVLILLSGGFITNNYSLEANMVINEGSSSNQLSGYVDRGEADTITPIPFSITLLDITREKYKDSDKVSDYISTISIEDNGIKSRAIISMNQPLRYKGYVFFQSSYLIQQDGTEASIFAVVKNSGRLLPYIATVLMCIGMILHFIKRIPALMMLLLLANNAQAQDIRDYTEFSKIPIMHSGRVMPLESFAAEHALIFNAKTSNPTKWLAEILFDQKTAYKDKIFKIYNPDIINLLGLNKNKKKLYSFVEISLAINRNMGEIENIINADKATLSLAQNQLLDIHNNMLVYYDISRSFSMFIEAENTEDTKSQIFKIIPPKWGNGEWTSPYSILYDKNIAQEYKQYLAFWYRLYRAYYEGGFNQQATNINLFVASQIDGKKLSTENIYNAVNPVLLSLILYILALVSLMFKRYKISLFLAISGAISHISAITMRMIISDRPPITNLYESVIFVGLFAVIFSLIIEIFRRDKISLIIAIIIAIVLSGVSYFFVKNGENMPALQAVLNTNFWLSTHVIIISIGYSLSIVTSVMAHIYLIKNNDNNRLSRLMVAIALLALLFTLLGTILGGIWADQSWGRFWGWDPKENGALLIVLWLLWALHGRVAGILNAYYFAVSMIITNIVVALAWFGVNLLGIGLHSYGFTSSMAIGLSIFCSAELLFAFWALYNNKKVD